MIAKLLILNYYKTIKAIIHIALTFEESDSFQAIAFSRPPPPTTRTFAITKTIKKKK